MPSTHADQQADGRALQCPQQVRIGAGRVCAGRVWQAETQPDRRLSALALAQHAELGTAMQQLRQPAPHGGEDEPQRRRQPQCSQHGASRGSGLHRSVCPAPGLKWSLPEWWVWA